MAIVQDGSSGILKMMRPHGLYLGFITALETVEEHSAEWDTLVAMLSALRACESVFGREDESPVMHDIAAVHVARVADLWQHRFLVSALAVADPRVRYVPDERSMHMSRKLFALGAELHTVGQYDLAVDVFGLVETLAGDEVDMVLQTRYARAFAYRQSQRFDEAEQEYHRLIDFADRQHVHAMRLEGELGLAKLTANRGKYGPARERAQRVVDEANALGEFRVMRKAYGQLAAFAGVAGDPASVLKYCYLELEGSTDPLDRERTLVNIGVALRELGYARHSKTVLDYVVRVAVRHETRVTAMMNRYHLAIDEQDWESCARFQSQLANERLTPWLSAELCETSAREYAARGLSDQSMHLIARMAAIAENAGLAEKIIRADQAMTDIRAGRVPRMYFFEPKPPATDEKSAVSAIAHALTADCLR